MNPEIKDEAYYEEDIRKNKRMEVENEKINTKANKKQ